MELAAKLNAEFSGINAEACVADLTKQEELLRVATVLSERASLQLLINGAGFGISRPFVEAEMSVHRQMIELHVLASVTLCRAVLPAMVAHDAGGIINIGSASAFTRFPGTAIYTATKMFLVAFTEVLEAELAKLGARSVRVQALCPGETRTPFTESETMRGYDASRVPWFMWMTPEALVELSLGALERKSGTYIPLLRNRLYCFVFGNRLINRILVVLRKYGVLEAILRMFKKGHWKTANDATN